MFAVIKTGGKQYRVAANDTITIATLPGEAGEAVTFGEVLLFADGAGATQVGAPTLSGINVTGEIVRHGGTRRSSPSRSAAAELAPQARPPPGPHRGPHHRHFRVIERGLS